MRPFWRRFSIFNLFPERRDPPMTYAQLVRRADELLAETPEARERRMKAEMRELFGCE